MLVINIIPISRVLKVLVFPQPYSISRSSDLYVALYITSSILICFFHAVSTRRGTALFTRLRTGPKPIRKANATLTQFAKRIKLSKYRGKILP